MPRRASCDLPNLALSGISTMAQLALLVALLLASSAGVSGQLSNVTNRCAGLPHALLHAMADRCTLLDEGVQKLRTADAGR